jgi:hypothetical protein
VRIEQLRERKPRTYVFVQCVEMKKCLGHVLKAWSNQGADRAAADGKVPPDQSRTAWASLLFYMDEIECIAREVKTLATEKLNETKADR